MEDSSKTCDLCSELRAYRKGKQICDGLSYIVIKISPGYKLVIRICDGLSDSCHNSGTRKVERRQTAILI